MIKFRLSYHKDDDIAWLNQLSKEGFAMTGFFAGFWHFDTCSPGEYEYQIDLSDRGNRSYAHRHLPLPFHIWLRK